MSRQVPKSITGFNGGALNIARAEPVCTAQIAAVAIRWTEIERYLVQLVNGALGRVQRQEGGALGLSGNAVARVAMQQAETIRTRIKLIDALIAPMLEGNELHQRWVDIREDLRRKSRQRNAIVHGDWTYASELPGELILQKGKGRERWSIAEFEAVQRGFHYLVMAITKLTADIAAAKLRGEIEQAEDRMNSMAIAPIGNTLSGPIKQRGDS